MFFDSISPGEEGEEDEDELAALAKDSETPIEELLKNRYKVGEGEEEEDEEEEDGEEEEDEEEEEEEVETKGLLFYIHNIHSSLFSISNNCIIASTKRKADSELSPEKATKRT